MGPGAGGQDSSAANIRIFLLEPTGVRGSLLTSRFSGSRHRAHPSGAGGSVPGPSNLRPTTGATPLSPAQGDEVWLQSDWPPLPLVSEQECTGRDFQEPVLWASSNFSVGWQASERRSTHTPFLRQTSLKTDLPLSVCPGQEPGPSAQTGNTHHRLSE